LGVKDVVLTECLTYPGLKEIAKVLQPFVSPGARLDAADQNAT